jgi:Domain of unknown function (DUF4148)
VTTGQGHEPGLEIRNFPINEGTNMTTIRNTTIALALAAAAGGAMSQGALTRKQVKAELAEAIRTGDIVGNGETGQKLNEMYPGRYPAKPDAPSKTRAQVRAELFKAQSTGDIAHGDSGRKLNELYPNRYPPMPAVAGKTRAEVKAELVEAVRTGNIIVNGESGLKANELFPGAYPLQARGRNAPTQAMTAQGEAPPAR